MRLRSSWSKKKKRHLAIPWIIDSEGLLIRLRTPELVMKVEETAQSGTRSTANVILKHPNFLRQEIDIFLALRTKANFLIKIHGIVDNVWQKWTAFINTFATHSAPQYKLRGDRWNTVNKWLSPQSRIVWCRSQGYTACPPGSQSELTTQKSEWSAYLSRNPHILICTP